MIVAKIPVFVHLHFLVRGVGKKIVEEIAKFVRNVVA